LAEKMGNALVALHIFDGMNNLLSHLNYCGDRSYRNIFPIDSPEE
jgi:hypothetical protein